MGQSVNYAVCNDCNTEFGIVLEWETKEEVLNILEETKCPNCKSDNWYLTDRMGNKEAK